MTENISMGDMVSLYDTHSAKRTGGTLSTVLGIIGAIIVLALLWSAYTRARDTRANTDAIASGTIGTLTSAVNGTQEEVRTLARFERQDALNIAYTDGVMRGPRGFYGHGDGPAWDGHHGHGHGGCGSGQQFREVRKFEEKSDDVEVISTCGHRC